MSSKSKQLELNGNLVPTMCLAYNTFSLVKQNNEAMVFTDHTKQHYLGIYSATTNKQKPIDPEKLLAFQSELSKNYTDAVLLVN